MGMGRSGRIAPDAPTGSELLAVRGLTKVYPGVRALDDFDLTLHPGEVHGLAGVNGAGKSTVIKVLSGVEPPSAGTISVAGHRQVTIDSPRDARRLGIGTVHQEIPLLPNLTAAQNVVLGVEDRGLLRRSRRPQAERRYREVAARFRGAPDPDVPLGELGLYAWQVVAIIRAIAQEARVLVLDEPTSSLSTAEREALHGLMEDLVENGIAILYVSHFLDDILQFADRVSVLRDGRLVHRGPAAELSSPQLLAAMTGGADIAVGRRATPRSKASREVALEVEELSCGRLQPVSFSVGAGERLGLYGLEDSGARDVLEAIFGLRPRRGSVRWRGTELSGGPRAAIDAGLGMVSGDRKRTMLPEWSVEANHALPALAQRPLLAPLSRGGARTGTAATIETLQVKATPAQRMGSLSGGNQQKVLLGRWLGRPDSCLLLDEPTRGVDLDGRAAIHRELLELADGGMSLLISSTDPEEIIELSDRVLIFAGGRVVADVDRDDTSTERLEQVTRDRSLHRAAA